MGSECFKILIGSIEYGPVTQFVPDEDDGSFQDGTSVKWLCKDCADEAGLYLDELNTECCELCRTTFVPKEAYLSESVIRLEWGGLIQNESTKGPRIVFVSDKSAHVHFSCACDTWGLPLWNLGYADDG